MPPNRADHISPPQPPRRAEPSVCVCVCSVFDAMLRVSTRQHAIWHVYIYLYAAAGALRTTSASVDYQNGAIDTRGIHNIT